MRTPTKRCCCRLTQYQLEILDRLADEEKVTRTEIIIRLLSSLVHDIQTGYLWRHSGWFAREDLFKENGKRTFPPHDCRVDFRLPVILADYLTFNGYKLSSCLTNTLQEYYDRSRAD